MCPLSCLRAVSHVLLYYVWWVVNLNNGELIPSKGDWLGAWDELVAKTAPTAAAARLYFTFLAVQFLFAFFMPGINIKGRADENGVRGAAAAGARMQRADSPLPYRACRLSSRTDATAC